MNLTDSLSVLFNLASVSVTRHQPRCASRHTTRGLASPILRCCPPSHIAASLPPPAPPAAAHRLVDHLDPGGVAALIAPDSRDSRDSRGYVSPYGTAASWASAGFPQYVLPRCSMLTFQRHSTQYLMAQLLSSSRRNTSRCSHTPQVRAPTLSPTRSHLLPRKARNGAGMRHSATERPTTALRWPGAEAAVD